MAIVTWDGKPHFKCDEPDADLERESKRKRKHAALLAAYAEVDARDGGRCWVTGRQTVTDTADSRVKRDHHHLRGRNVMPEWRADKDRIITVTRQAHRLITRGKIHVQGDDARQRIVFTWNGVPVEKRPFRILSKRRSQRVED